MNEYDELDALDQILKRTGPIPYSSQEIADEVEWLEAHRECIYRVLQDACSEFAADSGDYQRLATLALGFRDRSKIWATLLNSHRFGVEADEERLNKSSVNPK